MTATPTVSVAHPEFLRIARDTATDPVRLSRALDIVRAGQVERLPSGQWSVPSQSCSGGYVVSSDGRTCDCPDYQRRATACKHALAVQILRADERAECDAEQADEDVPPCPLHGDEECDWGCPGPSLDPGTVVIERTDAEQAVPAITVEPADEAVSYTLGLRGRLGSITVLPPPTDADYRARFAEMFPDDAA